LTCPCGRIRQTVDALRDRHAMRIPGLNVTTIVRLRNGMRIWRMHWVLIRGGKNAGGVTYNDKLVGFARVSNKFLPLLTRRLRSEFLRGEFIFIFYWFCFVKLVSHVVLSQLCYVWGTQSDSSSSAAG